MGSFPEVLWCGKSTFLGSVKLKKILHEQVYSESIFFVIK